MTIIYLINHSTSKLFNEFYTYEKWAEIQVVAVGDRGTVEGLKKMNIERPTSNIEWKK